MAKQASLGVNVNTTQLDNLIKSMTTLNRQTSALTNSFNQVAGAINNSTKAMQKQMTMVQSALQISSSFHKSLSKITSEFGKWGALIGGIVMMLGTGAGFMGMDRMSRSIMERRRQALGMGMGGDLAGMQAAQIAMTGTPGGADVMQNVAAGLYGDIDKRRVLNRLGIPYESGNMNAGEAMPIILKNLERQMRDVPQERLMQWAESRGYRQMFGDQFLTAHKQNPGLFAIEQEDMAKRPAPMSQEALNNWNRFSRAIARFTTELENRLGEKLSGVASSLTHLSEAFTKVIATLLDWPIVKTVLDKIAYWLDTLATFLEKDSTIKALEAFGRFFSETLKLEFMLFTGQFTDFINEVKSLVPTIQDTFKSMWSWLRNKLGIPDANTQGYDPDTGYPAPIQPGGPNAPTFTPGGNVGAPATGKQSSIASPTNFASNTSRSLNSYTTFASNVGKTMGNRGGVQTAMLTGTGPSGGSVWGPGSANAVAAQRAVPPETGGYTLASHMASLGFGGGTRKARGAQDINQWQGNRTYAMVVRDVMSANNYITAEGMAT